ncbi:Mor transcription activator family protein [Romboutsia maritimum]|uniref:Mor transcription activator family protein n=1 Tax=Romboutsia maritimum TaxID=2020948 RepID=UPI0038CD12CD
MYFPTEKMVYKEARDREIIEQFNGVNIKNLASKYNMSESYVRSIINKKIKSD